MVKLAIPNKGRLFEKTVKLLQDAGFSFEVNDRKLFTFVDNHNMEIIFTRTDDIPIYIHQGIVDLGITGEDIVKEHELDLPLLLKLGYGKCRMVVAAPKNKYSSVEELPKEIKVATSFPNIAKNYFKSKNITAKISDIHGAVEISPRLGLADVIIDITSSGTTLATNDLEILDVLFSSEASLFANPNSLNTKKEELIHIADSIKSVLNAKQKKYLMANIPKSELAKIENSIPAISAPTILPLSHSEDKVAIHTVINETEVNQVVKLLKQHNATGILVLNIERLFD